ncbi:MAG: hypothetical protein WAQ98_14730 [Blastocatellia bacterium]
MTTICLATYTLKIKEQDSGKNCILNNFGGSDIFNVIRNFLNNIQQDWYHNPEDKFIIRLREMFTDQDKRTIKGIIEAGDYGFSSKFRDIESRNFTYNRNPNHAEFTPFYFLLNFPLDRDEGILIFQRFGNKGIKTVFQKGLQTFFSTVQEGYRPNIQDLVPEKALELWGMNGDGKIKKIRYIKYGFDPNLAAFVGQLGHQESEGYKELTIGASRNRFLGYFNKFKETFTEEKPFSQFVSLIGFEPSEVKVEIDFNGVKRRINLKNANSMRAYFDITDEVKPLGDDGHPVYEKIDGEAEELLQIVQNKLYGTQS